MAFTVERLHSLFNLKIIHAGPINEPIVDHEVERPGLRLAGYYNYFQPNRIQILGKSECSYLSCMPQNERIHAINTLLSHPVTCVIVANNNEMLPELLDGANKYNKWLFRTPQETSELKIDLTLYLQRELAEGIQLHGTLVDVYGVGVLITGQSGIGKSETALSLIQNNHILISDDSVIIKRLQSDFLVGMGSDITKDLLEIRGIGIINIRSLYGLRAVRSDKKLDIIINLEPWNETYDYERVGESYEKHDILGIMIPFIRLPVRPGRALASIIEAAAINYRQREMNISTITLLDQRVSDHAKLQSK